MPIRDRVNQKSFWFFYFLMAAVVAFSYFYSYLWIDYPRVKEANPVVHDLALGFSRVFNTAYENYYLYSLPFILLGFLFIAKFCQWLIRVVDKKAKVSGDKHLVIFITLLSLPNALHQLIAVLFGYYLIDNPMLEFKITAILGFILAIGFLIYAETEK
ncbi:MAG: hypothetical protein AB1721_01435 [Patescibacteria group bacterium]